MGVPRSVRRAARMGLNGIEECHPISGLIGSRNVEETRDRKGREHARIRQCTCPVRRVDGIITVRSQVFVSYTSPVRFHPSCNFAPANQRLGEVSSIAHSSYFRFRDRRRKLLKKHRPSSLDNELFFCFFPPSGQAVLVPTCTLTVPYRPDLPVPPSGIKCFPPLCP